jgi:phosphoglycolate phosphatase-like HAD superfamily hydrolase
MILATIFDLDGTLLDLPIDYPKMYEEFRQIIGSAEVTPILETIGRIENLQNLQRIFETWEKFELAVLDKITVHEEGMKIFMQYNDLPKALVTMQGKEITNRILTRFRLSFKVVSTREDSVSRIRQLDEVIAKLGVDVENVLFIGNMDSDAFSARQIGCQFLRVK